MIHGPEYWLEPPEPPEQPWWCDHDTTECDCAEQHPPSCGCPECDPDAARDRMLDALRDDGPL